MKSYKRVYVGFTGDVKGCILGSCKGWLSGLMGFLEV